ncbi:MAG: glutathione S-transferase [Noviherbaspirillum sp.]
MAYQLYYWPGIQGRGEFVRLALEEGGADYEDIGRQEGEAVLLAAMKRGDAAHPPFAPPFLKSEGLLIGQTANILYYLGPRLGLAPADEAGRLWINQLQLTIADMVTEAHDSHHPVAAGLYYDEQKPEALRRAQDFTANRMAKYLHYFERVLAHNPGGTSHLAGAAPSYADLSLFQLVEGLAYAFPKALAQVGPSIPLVMALRDSVSRRPRMAAYLQSARRLPFSEEGIFRHYPELDAGHAAPQIYANPT